MAAVSSFFAVFLLSFLAMPLPVGVPPLPEDPALLRVAPEDSLVFLEWFGAGEPEAGSGNETEALIAEPQVQEMVRRVLSAIRDSAVREAGGQGVAGELVDLAAMALRRPGCVFLGPLGTPPQADSVQAGLVIRFGDDAANAELTLRKMEGLLVASLPPGMALENRDPAPVEGVTFRALSLPPGSPPVSWAMVDGYLALAIGEETPARIVRGLRGDEQGLAANATFTELQARVRVARPCLRSYLDASALIEMVGNLAGAPAGVIRSLGLGDVTALISESGLEGEGFAARSLVATSGRSGVLKLLEAPALSASDLDIVPGDSSFANVLSVNPLAVYRGVLELLDSVQPGLEDEFRGALRSEVEEGLGLRLEEDVLAHLGTTVSLWNSPGQGGLLITGLTAAWSLKDPQAFQQSFSKLMAVLRQRMPPKALTSAGRISRSVYLEEMDYEGHRIYYLNAVGEEMPFAPAWCVTETHVLFSLFPQMLRETIDRGLDRDSSLGARPNVLGEATTGLSYTDARQTFAILYPAAHFLAQVFLSQAQQQGIDLDISVLPSASSILPHLGTELSRISSTESGIVLERRGTLPFADSIFGGMGAPLLFASPWFIVARSGVLQAPQGRIRELPPPVAPPAPVQRVASTDQPWLAYEITSADQVFDPSTGTQALPWPEYVTEAERKEVQDLLDQVAQGGAGLEGAKKSLIELGHRSLFGIVNRLREVDYTDARETRYAYELNQVLEKITITITINANFQNVPPGQPLDLRVAHWNAQTVKVWMRLVERYSDREDWERLMQSIRARRGGRRH